jgi:hypothetical protein
MWALASKKKTNMKRRSTVHFESILENLPANGGRRRGVRRRGAAGRQRARAARAPPRGAGQAAPGKPGRTRASLLTRLRL